MGQPPLHLKLVVVPALELRHGMGREEFWRATLRGRFPRDRLRPVLAKFERARMLRVGPRAARAIEPFGLVHTKQRHGAADRNVLLKQRLAGRLERAPPAGGIHVRANLWLAHWSSRCLKAGA